MMVKRIAQYSDKMKEKTIIVNGMSKTYSMTGWRIGYIAASNEVAKAVSSMQSHTTSNACSIAQYASVAALSDPQGATFIKNMQKVFDERRKLMVATLKQVKDVVCIEPKGAFYVFINISALYGKKYQDNVINGSMSFAENALKFGVAVIPGIAFGDDDCIRLSYAVSNDDIITGIDRLKKFIKEIK